MIKKIFLTALIVLLIPLATLLHNNFGSSEFTQQEIDQAYSESIQWLKQNKSKVYETDNPMLWYMLVNAQKASPNKELQAFINGYLNSKNYYRSSIWSGLFGKKYPYTNADELINSGFNYYNLYLAYGLSCDKNLAELDIIQHQHNTHYCYKTIKSTACTTHQLMGMLLIKESKCAQPENITQKIDSLVDQTWWQSVIDFRVVDVYLQRQLMLLQTKPSKVNSRWIKRILDHQNNDGGWDGFQKLVQMGSKDFGFTRLIAGFGQEKSNFHATAQGINILALLKKEK